MCQVLSPHERSYFATEHSSLRCLYLYDLNKDVWNLKSEMGVSGERVSRASVHVPCQIKSLCLWWGELETKHDLWELPWNMLPCHSPHFCRKTLASKASPEFWRANLIREVRKSRNKRNQSRQNNEFSHKTKSRTFSSSSRVIDNILSHILELLCRH